MKNKVINLKAFTTFSLALLILTVFLYWKLLTPANPQTAPSNSDGFPVGTNTQTFSFTYNNHNIDLMLTKTSLSGSTEYTLAEGENYGTVFELNDNKVLVSLYEEANAVLIDLNTGKIDPVFGAPDPSKSESDNIYGVIWADILEVLPDKENVIFYTTRSGDFKIYSLNIFTGRIFEIPEEKYRDIVAWLDSTTAFIAEGLSDLTKEQYTLIKYNFETNQSTTIRIITSDELQSMTFYIDNRDA